MSTTRKVIACIAVFVALGVLSLSIFSIKSIEKMLELKPQKKVAENGILVSFKKNVSEKKVRSITKSLSKCGPVALNTADDGVVAALGPDAVKDGD